MIDITSKYFFIQYFCTYLYQDNKNGNPAIFLAHRYFSTSVVILLIFQQHEIFLILGVSATLSMINNPSIHQCVL